MDRLTDGQTDGRRDWIGKTVSRSACIAFWVLTRDKNELDRRLRFSSDADNVRLTNVITIIIIIIIIITVIALNRDEND